VKSSLVPNYESKTAGGTANYNNYSNPQVDQLLAQSNTQLDFTQRTATLNQVDKLMADDLHSIPLFQLPDFSASVSTIGPVSYIGATGGPLWNAFAWTKKG
jgi:peptide/nickel transport system substrate-binding protein